jgi:hypothetical protein
MEQMIEYAGEVLDETELGRSIDEREEAHRLQTPLLGLLDALLVVHEEDVGFQFASECDGGLFAGSPLPSTKPRDVLDVRSSITAGGVKTRPKRAGRIWTQSMRIR